MVHKSATVNANFRHHGWKRVGQQHRRESAVSGVKLGDTNPFVLFNLSPGGGWQFFSHHHHHTEQTDADCDKCVSAQLVYQ